jgi:hypothetical protein
VSISCVVTDIMVIVDSPFCIIFIAYLHNISFIFLCLVYFHRMNTQMLTFFSEERIYHPDHTEVKFFDESILDKLNRSVTTVNKMTTPFLNDKR